MSKSPTYYKAWWIIKKKKLLNELSGNKSTNYTKFIILSSGRCGSTLLHTYLNSNPNILSKGEILQRLYDGDKPNAPKEIASIVFPVHGSNIKAVGLKLFYDYREMDNFKNAFEALANDRSIKVIHLVRENKLEQFVSYKRAWRDLEWSANPRNRDYVTKVKVDIHEYSNFVNENEIQRKMALEMFEGHEFIDLTYEELTNSGQRCLLRIQEFLGVKVSPLFTALEKQNDKPLKEVVENWEEVNAMIKL